MKNPLAALWADADLRRFLKFLMVGFMNTVFGYTLYATLVWSGIPPLRAFTIGFCIGVVWNFMTHGKLVFASTGVKRLPIFAAVYVGIYFANRTALSFLLDSGVNPYLAQAFILPFAAVATFLGVGTALTGRLPVDLARFRKRRD